MLPNEILLIPMLSILVYIPVVCYLDLKYREIHHGWWIPLAALNIPVMLYCYLSGVYTPELFLVSMVFIGIYFVAMKLHLFEGADFMFLLWISLFFVVNPLSEHVLMPLVMFEMLVACLVSFGIVTIAVKWHNFDAITGEMLRGFPMMLPISAAYIFTVVLG